MTDSAARIHDRGYRRYEGVRRGPAHAVHRLTLHTLQRILGLRRPARAKVLPFLSAIVAYLPAIVFVGLAAFLPRQITEGLPRYDSYYGFIGWAIILFVSFAAPEALTADRRSRTLSLYLAAPLTRTTYLAAQGAAIALAISIVTTGPPLLLLVGFSLQNVGPDGPLGVAAVLARVLGAGGALAAFHTAISLAVSSRTDRRGVASASTFAVFFASSVIARTIADSGRLPEEARLFALMVVPYELVARIYGQPGDYPGIATWVVAAAVAGWTAAGAGIAWLTYQRLQVTR